jgi:alpha-1,6-mannosyltransferase
MGRLGPIGDSAAMARNILEIWGGDRQAMAREARERALQFSWDRSMEALFSEVHPAAFARRAERRLAASQSVAPFFAKA